MKRIYNMLAAMDFIFEGVRCIILENGAEFYNALDVARALGICNPEYAIHEYCNSIQKVNINKSNGESYSDFYISRDDIFVLIFHSYLPISIAFKELFISEIIPSVEYTGAYIPSTSKAEAEEWKRKYYDLKAKYDEVQSVNNIDTANGNVIDFVKQLEKKVYNQNQYIENLENIINQHPCRNQIKYSAHKMGIDFTNHNH